MSIYKQPNGSSLYGNYRTRTFSNIFESSEIFKEEWDNSIFKSRIEELDVDLIFILLYARYGNSNIASSDENRFKQQLFSIIFQYGPTWKKRLEIQSELRGLSIADAAEGARSIYNHAYNPSSAPSTQDTFELSFVSDQNVSKYTKAPVEAAMNLWDMLRVDVSEIFIKQFQKLFLTIVEPESPLWYITYPEEE